MIEIKYTGDALWARIERAVEIVKERLRRVTAALNAAALTDRNTSVVASKAFNSAASLSESPAG